MKRALALAALATLATPSCSERPLTQLVVVADSNLAIPGQLDTVEIEIVPPMGSPVHREDVLTDVTELPVSLGVVHRGGALGPVMVVARGRRGLDVVVERTAEVFFVTGRTLVLDVALEASCIGIPCDDRETCEHGVCRSVVVTADELRDYDGTLPRLGDAGETCFPERCNDVDDDCDGNIDEAVDTSSDPDNCGACGNVCPARQNGRPACAAGLCTVTCEEGHGDCNIDPRDGCEEPLNTLAMCMECGVDCEVLHGAPSCFTGTCEVQTCAPGWGDCNTLSGDGCESPLDDLLHCGTCAPCAPAGAVGACTAGVCSIGACEDGRGDCNTMVSDGCETTLGSLGNCARCGDACPMPPNATAACALGTCGIGACEAGWDDCDGASANGCETDLRTMSDCNACGVACALAHATEACTTSGCGIVACEDGWGDCNTMASDGCERSLETGTDCGTCGRTCGGTSPLCGLGAGSVRTCVSACMGSMEMCGSGCVETQSSLAHCGGCDMPCAPAHAVAECAAGRCGIVSCDPGWGDCNTMASDGCETELVTMTHCGACGAGCDLAYATESCDAGRCVLDACAADRADCNGMTTDGCEVDLLSLEDCGTCGTTCALANATETCATGTCEIVDCAAGRADCDGLAADGCEAMLGSLSNCQACNDVCDLPRAAESCATGMCELGACEADFEDCNGMREDGCERSTTTLTDCGGCGVDCGPFENATASCTTGACTFACLPGFGDCNGMASDGCEEPLTTATHCGSCSTACSGATPVCTLEGDTASCTSSCGTGTTACGLVCADVLVDPLHCGACDTPCAPAQATGACTDGACRIASCEGGFADCNGMVTDGCERATTTTTDCGTCDMACPTYANATPACELGACAPICAANFGDCDGMASTGCERALTTTANCGGCGVMCTSVAGATVSCDTGACVITGCPMGRADCNDVFSDGCEANTTTSAMHCGGCGMPCPGTEICRMGRCRAP